MKSIIKDLPIYILALETEGGQAIRMAQGFRHLGVAVLPLPGKEDGSSGISLDWFSQVPKGSLVFGDYRIANHLTHQNVKDLGLILFAYDRRPSSFFRWNPAYAGYFKVNYPTLNSRWPSSAVPSLIHEDTEVLSPPIPYPERQRDLLVACSLGIKKVRVPTDIHKSFLDELLYDTDLNVHAYWYTHYSFLDKRQYPALFPTFKACLGLPGGEEQCFRTPECFRSKVALIFKEIPVHYPHGPLKHLEHVFALGHSSNESAALKQFLTSSQWSDVAENGHKLYHQWYSHAARAYYFLRVMGKHLDSPSSNLFEYAMANPIPFEAGP